MSKHGTPPSLKPTTNGTPECHSPAWRQLLESEVPAERRTLNPLSRKTGSVMHAYTGDLRHMWAVLIGYARASPDAQDLTAQRDALAGLGVEPERLYVDHGLTGINRDRPGLRQALAACRTGDTFVVTKFDRLARSLPDARAIVDELTTGQVKLNPGGSVHDRTDPVGRLLFNVLAMVAELEADLARRTREGMKVARAKGRLRGKQPKLSPRQEAHLVSLYRGGEYTAGELEELFSITRSMVYRAIRRSSQDMATAQPDLPVELVDRQGQRCSWVPQQGGD